MSAPGPSWYDSIAASTLGSGNLRDALKLPMGEDKNEWLAVNVIDLVNQVRMIFGVVCESECTDAKCPTMTAEGREYSWTNDGTLLATSAPQYIDLSMSSCQLYIEDDNLFPSEIGKQFPPNFEEVCQTIMRRLFRVFAHVYHAHIAHFKDIKALPHLNTSFKQFVLFANQFRLLNKEETEPLRSIIEGLVSSS